MASDPVWKKILGIVNGYLKFGFTGPHVEKDGTDASQLNIRANNGTSDAKVNVATAHVDALEIEAPDAFKTC